jgi:hypothetical protein
MEHPPFSGNREKREKRQTKNEKQEKRKTKNEKREKLVPHFFFLAKFGLEKHF